VKSVVDPDFAPEGHPEAQGDVLRLAWIVSACVVAFAVVFAVWASNAYLDEVTRGDGRVIPSQRVQVVQNLEGGIVSEILVRDGQIVERDAPLLRIANVTAESDLLGGRAQAATLRAAIARLEAESRGDSITFPDDLLREAPQLAEQERSLMATRRQQLDSQLAVIRDQQAQRRSEIAELRGRVASLTRSIELARQELAIIGPLVRQGAAARIDEVRIQRQISDLQGQIDAALASIPRAESALAESPSRRSGSRSASPPSAPRPTSSSTRSAGSSPR
jgi:adhesin transport system membrane fusion protein